MTRPLATRLLATATFLALTLGLAVAHDNSPAAMAAAGTSFLQSLTPEQRQQAAFEFGQDERTRWNYIPTEQFPRKGLTIKQMSDAQRKLAHDLLKTGMSQRGYMTATQIMGLETVLGAIEAAQRAAAAQPPQGTPLVRDSERYFFSIFGVPSTKATWGWRVEGHHVSLHFTIVDGALVAGSPSFFGSNPGEVREGPRKGTRILALEEDAARTLLETLNAAQRVKAVIDTTAPNDVVTKASVKIDPLSPAGIPAADLSAAQRLLLVRLVDVYIGRMSDDIAANVRARIEKGGWDNVAFAWAGTGARGAKHYYRVQGPTFLIEYDNTQNDGNHIHSVWREFNGDFGADLLRDHIKGTPHL
ncbi:MAG: DUF3500 domain-containing protein [bacterium]